MTVNMQNKIQVMVVDDSRLIREFMIRCVESEPDMTVKQVAVNGQHAVDILKRDPSIEMVLLDIEMPIMDGLTCLPKLLEIKPELNVIVASTLTQRGAQVSFECLRLGAKDFIPKPSASQDGKTLDFFKQELIEKIRALCRAKSGVGHAATKIPTISKPLGTSLGFIQKPMAIAIGSSTGGPQALATLVKGLTNNIRQPIFIVQHMPPLFTKTLAEHLSRQNKYIAKEAEDGEIVKNSTIYVAPGDYHMIVEARGVDRIIRLNQNPHENFCRPAVDPLFRSLADAYLGSVFAVVLTGIGSDGCNGAAFLVNKGGNVIAQDEASSVVWGMPKAVYDAKLTKALFPIDEIAGVINSVANGLPASSSRPA